MGGVGWGRTKGDERGEEGGGEGKEREIPFPSHLDLLFQGWGGEGTQS